VQQLQFFLSEADWDAVAVTTRRIELLRADALTTPHAQGALVIDETGDRKDGTHTAHVAHQYLGSIGKIANGIVAVTSLWADARVYYPLHVRPCTCGPTRAALHAGSTPRGRQARPGISY
jgi:SRSO17 transposase